MRPIWVVLLFLSCGRTNLALEPDGGGDAGPVTLVDRDAGPTRCIPGSLTPGALLAMGPRLTLPRDNPKLLDGVMTPAGRVFALLDPQNTRVLLLGPGWVREVSETTSELFRVHLAWNGAQLAMTWQAGRRLMFALFDAEGALQHQRELTDTTQADEAVAGFAGGTWIPVWTHGLNTSTGAWATRIFPDGGDQTLSQKLTNQPLAIGFPASGISALVSDAGIIALVLAETSTLAFASLQPTHQAEVPLEGSRGRGALVAMAVTCAA